MKRALLIGLIVMLMPLHTDSTYMIQQQRMVAGLPNKIEHKVTKRKYDYIDLGTYTITAYCSCAKCCGNSEGITASGKKVKENHTVAVDTRKIPLGTKIQIEGFKGITFVAEDTGGAIKSKRIDVYMKSHSACLEFGVKKLKVTMLKERGKKSCLKSTKV